MSPESTAPKVTRAFAGNSIQIRHNRTMPHLSLSEHGLAHAAPTRWTAKQESWIVQVLG